nr:hypothetical protein CFP56_75642 [Quercus suber]
MTLLEFGTAVTNIASKSVQVNLKLLMLAATLYKPKAATSHRIIGPHSKISSIFNAAYYRFKFCGVCVSTNARIEQIQEHEEASADMEVEFQKQMTEIKCNSSSLDMMTAECK